MGSEGNSVSTVCEGGFNWVIRIHCHTAWHGIKDVLGGRWAKLELASYIPPPPALADKLSIRAWELSVVWDQGGSAFGLQGHFPPCSGVNIHTEQDCARTLA